MEGNQRDLEAEPHDEERDPGQQHRARRRNGDRIPDAAQIERAGGAVHERDPVEEEPRREGAQKEVLERALDRSKPRPAKARQYIHSDRHELQPHEDRDQVAGQDHDQHARGRHENQVVILGQVDVVAPAVSDREQEREERSGQDDAGEEDAEAVQHDHAAEVRTARRIQSHRLPDDAPEREHRSDQRQVGRHDRSSLLALRRPAGAAQLEDVDEEREQAKKRQDGRR